MGKIVDRICRSIEFGGTEFQLEFPRSMFHMRFDQSVTIYFVAEGDTDVRNAASLKTYARLGPTEPEGRTPRIRRSPQEAEEEAENEADRTP